MLSIMFTFFGSDCIDFDVLRGGIFPGQHTPGPLRFQSCLFRPVPMPGNATFVKIWFACKRSDVLKFKCLFAIIFPALFDMGKS